jgi:hypothetical protein
MVNYAEDEEDDPFGLKVLRAKKAQEWAQKVL